MNKQKNSSDKKILKIKKHLVNIEKELLQINNIISGYKISQFSKEKIDSSEYIEGIFNGTVMIDKNGKEYQVPENYASKSKLVDGDKLKLTIEEDGRQIYKQIEPASRKRKNAIFLGRIKTDYIVESNGIKYKVLKASATYFKLNNKDKVIISIPKEDSSWAAIENKL